MRHSLKRLAEAARLSLLVCALAVAGVGCTTQYVRIGRPATPPAASLEAEEQLLELYEAGALNAGDPLEAYLFQVENYMDYIHDLRGDSKHEE